MSYSSVRASVRIIDRSSASVILQCLSVAMFMVFYQGCSFPIEAALDAPTQPVDPNAPDTPDPAGTNPFDGDPITSSFTDGEEGWMTVHTGTISWEASGGRAGAYATAVTDGDDYWIAPDKFLGILSNAYGHSLRFSRRVEETGYSNYADVILVSSRGIILRHSFDNQTSSAWTDYKVKFQDTEWVNAENEVATESEVRLVLEDLSKLLIRTGAYDYSEGSCDLDEVTLEADQAIPVLPSGVQSTFDQDEEAWTTLYENNVRWQTDEEDRHGGYVSQESDYDFWVAPPTFLDALPSAYGQVLTFELRTDIPGDNYEYDIELNGKDDTRLHYEFPFGATQVWTRFTVTLKENGWFNDEGEPAKTSEMKAVLSEPSQLLIATSGYRYYDATIDLDNVAIELP